MRNKRDTATGERLAIRLFLIAARMICLAIIVLIGVYYLTGVKVDEVQALMAGAFFSIVSGCLGDATKSVRMKMLGDE